MEEVWAADTWGLEDGLPQSSVTAIEATGDGRLFLGTFAGLVRFDGQHFESLGGLGDAPVRVTSLSRSGDDLLVGTEQEGLWRFDGVAFSREELPAGLRGDVIWQVQADLDGTVWLGAASGAWRRSPDGGWQRLHDRQAKDIDADGSGGAWICAEGVAHWTADEGLQLQPGPHCAGGTVTADGSFAWISDEGLHTTDDAGTTLRDVAGLDTHYQGAPLVDGHGAVWVGSGDSVLDVGAWSELRASGGATEPRRRHPLTGTVRALHGSTDGGVWIGTDGGGLQRVGPMGFSRIARTDVRGGTGAGPLTVTSDAAWYSLDCQHLLRSGPDLAPELVVTPHLQGCISAMASTAEGSVLLARGNVLLEHRPDGEATHLFEADEEISLLTPSRAGGTWVGSTGGRLWHLDGDAHELTLPPGLEGRRLLALVEDGERLWLGHAEGLAWRDTSGWSLVGEGDGLPRGAVRDLFRDDQGTLWIATYGGGLGWAHEGLVGRLPTGADGIPDPFLSSLGRLGRDQLWLQGNTGLIRVSLEDLQVARLQPDHPVHSDVLTLGEANGFRRGSAGRLDDHLWLAGVEGVAVVGPQAFGDDLVLPAVVLERVQVGDHLLDTATGGTVPGDERRRLDVSYHAPSLEKALSIAYQHRVLADGEDDVPWVEAGHLQAASYPSLAPGRFTFEARTVALDGETGPVTRVAFVIRPQWHERGLVRLGLGLFATVLALAFGLRTSRAAEARARSLEREVVRRREAEEQLADREARYRHVFTQAANAFVLLGPGGRCLEVNERARELFRADDDELIGRDAGELGLPRGGTLPASDRDTPVLCRRLDGTDFPARVGAVACQVAEGEGELWTIVDVTRLVEAHEQEGRLRRQLQTAQRLEALGRLSGGMAHNLNNLLSIISANVGHVRSSTDDPELLAALDDARQGVRRAADLLRQLLAFSRRGHGGTGTADPAVALESLRGMLGPLLPPETTLSFGCDAQVGVPLPSGQLEQVLLNLVLNAAQASPAETTIRVTVRRDDEDVRIEVEDEGSGIAPDELDLVFDPFYTTKEPGEGTGLGLSSVKGIVDDAGGRVWLEPAPSGGTRAVVVLPACEQPAGATAAQAVRTGQLALAGEIVLVDDNAPLLRSLGRRLRKLELPFRTFTDPVAARDALLVADEPPGLLISDIVMPGLNGAQLVQALRKRWPELPVLFMSGYSSDVLGEGTLGDIELLEKPFSPESLAAAIARVVPTRAETG